MGPPFTFVAPPEAPIFTPSEEEFKDPLDYILKIRHIGVKTGICKIIPPKSWNPPFAVDMKKFSFTPRLQRLYELEVSIVFHQCQFLQANSRVKLQFISRLYNFMNTRGVDKIRVPSINGRYLDLYLLYKTVRNFGGYVFVNQRQKWTEVTSSLGYPSRFASKIKANYERLLLEFDKIISEFKEVDDKNKTDLPQPVAKELRNLQFRGAGPKTAVPCDPTTQPTTVGEYSCLVCHRDNDESNLLVCDTEACQRCYHTYCLSPPLLHVPKLAWKCPNCIHKICTQVPEAYGFPQSNKSYSLHEFGLMADKFKSDYFNKPCSEISCSEVEQEFWRILQEYNDDVIVEYGADIHSSEQGSGFPTLDRIGHLANSPEKMEAVKEYAAHPWNLNVLPLLNRSLLRFIKGNIDGMKIPWCYVGMVFSSFCWHIEDHWTTSLNFLHWGEPKTWYGVSRYHAEDFERAMRKHAPELFDQSPDLLHHITTIMNPNLLQAEGVPIYRVDQHCGEFVLTFPRAYHAGFNQGFNFAEAVNVCLPDWLSIGRACIDHYAEVKRPCVFSNDELICTLAEVVIDQRKLGEFLQSAGDSSNQLMLPPLNSTGLDIGAIAAVHQELSVMLAKEIATRRQTSSRRGVRTAPTSVRFDLLPDDARICRHCMTTLFLSSVGCKCSPPLNELIDPNTPGVVRRSGLRRRKRRAPPPATTDQDAASKTTSTEDCDQPPSIDSHMTCLSHVDQLCSVCKPTDFVVWYHYTLEELEQLELKLANRLTDYYDWRDQLARITTTKPSPVVVKTEEKTGEIGQKQLVQDHASMSLGELEAKLNSGRSFGYECDDLFSNAQTMYDRAKSLANLCAKFKMSLLGHGGGGDVVKFPFGYRASLAPPAIAVPGGSGDGPSAGRCMIMLEHEANLDNLTETDCQRLLEACKQQLPIDLSTESDFQFIAHLLDQLSDWRKRITAQVGPQLTPLFAPSTLMKSTTTTTNAVGDRSGQAYTLIVAALDDLQGQAPGLVNQLQDWLALRTIQSTVLWLHLLEKQLGGGGGTGQQKLTTTLPWLRCHLVIGEDLLKQLSLVGNTTSSNKPPLPKLTKGDPGAASTGDSGTLLASLARPLRPKMHTGLGQLSQVLVQIESLIEAIDGSLSLETCNFVELRALLDQLVLANIGHLTEYHCPRDDTEDRRDTLALSSSFTILPSEMPQCLIQAALDQAASNASDTTVLLRQLETKIDQVSLDLVSNSQFDRPIKLECRPRLVDIVALRNLAALVRPVSSSNLQNNLLPPSQIDRLSSLALCTEQTIDQLYRLFPSTSNNQNRLLELLLPPIVKTGDGSGEEREKAIQLYLTAFNDESTSAACTYLDHLSTPQSTSTREKLSETAAPTPSLCGSCIERFTFYAQEVDQSACYICTHSSSTSPVTLDQLSRLLLEAQPQHGSLMATPELLAVDRLIERAKTWITNLTHLLHRSSRINLSPPTDQQLLDQLPVEVKQALVALPDAQSPPVTTNDEKLQLTQSLRSCLLSGLDAVVINPALIELVKRLLYQLTHHHHNTV